MLQKVVICGVDTAGLPKLSAKENDELMQRLKAGDEHARELFIVGNMRLVLSLVKRFWAKNANADCTSPLSASIRCILLKAPKLKASRDSQQHVKLAWKRNAKATGYVVYRSDRKKGGYHKIAKLANGREGYIDRTAQKGQTYYYKVKAFKRWGSRVCYGMQSERIMVKVLSNK